MINTGWSGGPYGVGKRISLDLTRAMVRAIHEGKLEGAPTRDYPQFQLSAVTRCPGVPDDLLQPEKTWASETAFNANAQKLSELFDENIKGIETGKIRAMEG